MAVEGTVRQWGYVVPDAKSPNDQGPVLTSTYYMYNMYMYMYMYMLVTGFLVTVIRPVTTGPTPRSLTDRMIVLAPGLDLVRVHQLCHGGPLQ